MSRIGKQPIQLPDGVSAKIEGGCVIIAGPKGKLTVNIPPKVRVEQKDTSLEFSVPTPEISRQAAFWGLGRSLVANAVIGVTQGFSKKLEVNGVGYKVTKAGDNLVLNVGYSHPVEIKPPAGIEISVDGKNITISGIDKQLVGAFASKIRSIRKPEPYKGKGIKYDTEVIRRKAGKVVKESEG